MKCSLSSTTPPSLSLPLSLSLSLSSGDKVVCRAFILIWLLYTLYYPFWEIQAVLRLQQPQKQRYPVLQMHAGPFRVSVIHQTLTWTSGSLKCVHDHSYACIYTQRLGTQTMSQHNIFDSEKLSQIFVMLLIGFEPRVFGSQVWCSNNWATPSPHSKWSQPLLRVEGYFYCASHVGIVSTSCCTWRWSCSLPRSLW